METLVSEHLWKIGNALSACPAASRFYMCNLERNLSEGPDLLNIGSKKDHLYCKHCGSLWVPGNYKVRVLPCPSLNRHLKKLLKLEAEQPWKINKHHKNKLKKFQESSNKIVYSCFICKKNTVFAGETRPKLRIRAAALRSKPLPKTKLKKGDLNAGLFIPSPSCSSYGINKMYGEKNKPIVSSETPDTKTPLKYKTINLSDNKNTNAPKIEISIPNKRLKYKIFPNVNLETPESTISSVQKISSTKQKYKTLLKQVLKQEESSKKKISLSSFLISF